MQARCPHCQNVFSAERPGVQFCPHCGKQLDVPGPAEPGAIPSLPVTPGGPFPSGPGEGAAPSSGRGPTPWERRAELGFFPALFETWKGAMFDPRSFYTRAQPQAPWAPAAGFAWLVWAVGKLIGLPFLSLGNRQGMQLLHQFADYLPEGRREQVFTALERSGHTSVAQLLVSALLFPLTLIVAAAIFHLAAMVLGAAKNGYEATLRTLAYAMAPALFIGLPVLNLVAMAWSLVLFGVGLQPMQETTQGKAWGAVLLPAVPCCFCCICGAGVFAVGLASLLQNH